MIVLSENTNAELVKLINASVTEQLKEQLKEKFDEMDSKFSGLQHELSQKLSGVQKDSDERSQNEVTEIGNVSAQNSRAEKMQQYPETGDDADKDDSNIYFIDPEAKLKKYVGKFFLQQMNYYQ